MKNGQQFSGSRYAVFQQQNSAPVHSELDSRTDKFAANEVLPTEGRVGFYFSDSVIEPFIDAAHDKVLSEAASPKLTGSTFSLSESRELILEALKTFDPGLHKKAADIFDAGFKRAVKSSDNQESKQLWNRNSYFTDEGARDRDSEDLNRLASGIRWRIAKTSPNETFMMRCLPAESPASPLGPANNHPQAIIDYHFDGTINSVIYMAHELGHAIADDYIRERGHKFDANPQHMDETQAYFVQNILYDHLVHHPDARIAETAKIHFTDTLTENLLNLPMPDAILDARVVERLHSRPMGILTATGVFNLAKERDAEKRREISEVLLGRQGPKNIIQTLAVAGVATSRDMQAFADRTVGIVTSGEPISFRPPHHLRKLHQQQLAQSK